MMIGLNDSDVTSSLAPPSPPPPSDLIVPRTASRPIDTSPAAAHGESFGSEPSTPETQTISFLSVSPVGPGGATPPEEEEGEELDEWREEEDDDEGLGNEHF